MNYDESNFFNRKTLPLDKKILTSPIVQVAEYFTNLSKEYPNAVLDYTLYCDHGAYDYESYIDEFDIVYLVPMTPQEKAKKTILLKNETARLIKNANLVHAVRQQAKLESEKKLIKKINQLTKDNESVARKLLAGKPITVKDLEREN